MTGRYRLLPVVGLLLLTACATIDLDSTTMTKAPVKMNAVGEQNYDVLREFTIQDKAGWVIGIVPVNKPGGDHHDYLASLINAEVDKAGGDAAINVHIRAQNDLPDVVIGIVTMGLYQTRTVTVTGQIIKYR